MPTADELGSLGIPTSTKTSELRGVTSTMVNNRGALDPVGAQ